MDTEAQDTERLLARVAGKDKTAFEDLYRRLSRPVFHYLYRLLQNRETAEDLLMDVFCVVWDKAGKFKGNSRVKTWVFGIARNMAYNQFRKKGRYSDPVDDGLRDDRSTVPFKGFENHDRLHKALAGISPKHREVLDLVFYHDTPYSEVGVLLDIPENTVKTRVYYAKAALKKNMIRLEGGQG